MEDSKEQEDEILVLQSIYDESVLDIVSENDRIVGGEFRVKTHFPDSFFIKTIDVEKGDKLHKIKHLPPVILNFQLPTNYPSESPPSFTLSSPWLTRIQLSQVCKEMDQIWEDNNGVVILFSWTNFLQEELFEFLGLNSPLDISNIATSHHNSSTAKYDSRCYQDIESQDWLLVTLLDYDRSARNEDFKKSVFLCNICFQQKPGSVCFRFDVCDHVFCCACIRDYFIVKIEDGNVQELICPQDKCESEAHPSQVKDLVPEEKYSRYDELLLKLSLDLMMDIMYCPRTLCQSPVLMEKDNNIGRCPSCQFVFCRSCKSVYHGLSPCRLKAEELNMLKDEYENADDLGKKLLEKKYGKKAIAQAMEEFITRTWLDNFTKTCPACGFHIQKEDGCNKITCINCRNYFCWLCGDSLSRSNPYNHYNAKGPCVNRLFEGIEEFDIDFFD